MLPPHGHLAPSLFRFTVSVYSVQLRSKACIHVCVSLSPDRASAPPSLPLLFFTTVRLRLSGQLLCRPSLHLGLIVSSWFYSGYALLARSWIPDMVWEHPSRLWSAGSGQGFWSSAQTSLPPPPSGPRPPRAILPLSSLSRVMSLRGPIPEPGSWAQSPVLTRPLWPWVRYFTSLGFTFLYFIMEIIVPTAYACYLN